MPALGFLLRHFRLKELFGEASFSTGDPAATALLWGAAEAFFQEQKPGLPPVFPGTGTESATVSFACGRKRLAYAAHFGACFGWHRGIL